MLVLGVAQLPLKRKVFVAVVAVAVDVEARCFGGTGFHIVVVKTSNATRQTNALPMKGYSQEGIPGLFTGGVWLYLRCQRKYLFMCRSSYFLWAEGEQVL